MSKFETKCVQAGYKPKKGEPRLAPIAQSTTFYYEKTEELADLFDLKASGYFYSRLANPTVAALEEKVAALENGTFAIATSSGQAATLFSILNVCQQGDNILSSSDIYGGTFNLFNVTLRKYGIETRFFNPDSSKEDIEKLVDDNTKAIFAETISNPSMVVLDFDKLKDISKKYEIIFIVDNTLATPYFCKPFEFGANIVVHSSSKYLDGHGAALGGILVDGGNFEYKGNKRYKEFNEPDSSYHGLVYSDLGNVAFGVKARVQLMRDLGAMMSPQNAFLTNLGTDTLHLRMQRHGENANKVAEFLQNHKKVAWVKHPSLKDDKYHELAKKYTNTLTTGMLSFGVKGGVDKVKKFADSLELISIVTHVADARSCLLHPASTTHRQLSKKDLENSGISEDLVRLSVGIENEEDIINDLKQALEKI